MGYSKISTIAIEGLAFLKEKNMQREIETLFPTTLKKNISAKVVIYPIELIDA